MFKCARVRSLRKIVYRAGLLFIIKIYAFFYQFFVLCGQTLKLYNKFIYQKFLGKTSSKRTCMKYLRMKSKDETNTSTRGPSIDRCHEKCSNDYEEKWIFSMA